MSPTAIDDATLLDAWDRASALARPWRELALLAVLGASHPHHHPSADEAAPSRGTLEVHPAGADGAALEGLARLPVGERDRRLLGLRGALLGERLECETACPACGARLEMILAASALACPPVASDEESSVEHDGCRVRFRLPTSADLAACGGGPAAAQALLERCVVDAICADEQVDARALPAPVVDAVAARMAALDPQADVRLALDCPDCGHAWEAELDVAGVVLAEIDAYATRLLGEVHGLASAYGWREDEILALSPRRRRRYLELAWS